MKISRSWILTIFLAAMFFSVPACSAVATDEPEPVPTNTAAPPAPTNTAAPPSAPLTKAEIAQVIARFENIVLRTDDPPYVYANYFDGMDETRELSDENSAAGYADGGYRIELTRNGALRVFTDGESASVSTVGVLVNGPEGSGEYVVGVVCHNDGTSSVALGISPDGYWAAMYIVDSAPGDIIGRGVIDYDEFYAERGGQLLIEAMCTPGNYILSVNGVQIAEVRNLTGSPTKGNNGFFVFNKDSSYSNILFDDFFFIGLDFGG